MPTRKAEAEWSGDLKAGHGTMELGSGAFKGAYSFRSRMEDGAGTNPEELLGAAHAGCYSMQLSAMLAAAGHPPTRLHTTAHVHFARPAAASRSPASTSRPKRKCLASMQPRFRSRPNRPK